MGQLIDITGKRYGMWVVIAKSRKTCKSRAVFWLCECDCGSIKEVRSASLLGGLSRSCGCEPRARAARSSANTNQTHGLAGTTEYNTWRSMLRRCYDPKANQYRDYGGRGISVCEPWRSSPSAFLSDMGRKPLGMSLDRINVNGNYEPSNCRWADRSTQNTNQRKPVCEHCKALLRSFTSCLGRLMPPEEL